MFRVVRLMMDGEKLDIETPRAGWILLATAILLGGAAAVAYGILRRRTLSSAHNLLDEVEASLHSLEARIAAQEGRRAPVSM
jgi:hypothetical protein